MRKLVVGILVAVALVASIVAVQATSGIGTGGMQFAVGGLIALDECNSHASAERAVHTPR